MTSWRSLSSLSSKVFSGTPAPRAKSSRPSVTWQCPQSLRQPSDDERLNFLGGGKMPIPSVGLVYHKFTYIDMNG